MDLDVFIVRLVNGLFVSYIVALPFFFFIRSGLASEFSPPSGFYLSADGLEDIALKNELHLLSERPSESNASSTIIFYSQTDETMAVVDAVPFSNDQIFLIYSNETQNDRNIGSSGPNVWNREHTWPRSYGIGSEEAPDNSDMHALFPCNAQVNSDRSNKFFDWTPNGTSHPLAPDSLFDFDSWEPRDEDKGRIARAMFYMATRYDGNDPFGGTIDLKLSDNPNPSTGTMGKLSVLLEWNRLFPPDERERRRNHLIHTDTTSPARFQANRNPFIDHPEYADAIFEEKETYGRWRVRHFTSAELEDATITLDDSDPDGDGRVNILEFCFGSDPNIPDRNRRLPSATIITNENGVFAEYTFWCLDPTEESLLSHEVEMTDDLNREWSNVLETPQLIQTQDAYMQYKVRCEIPVGVELVFFRSVVSYSGWYGD